MVRVWNLGGKLPAAACTVNLLCKLISDVFMKDSLTFLTLLSLLLLFGNSQMRWPPILCLLWWRRIDLSHTEPPLNIICCIWMFLTYRSLINLSAFPLNTRCFELLYYHHLVIPIIVYKNVIYSSVFKLISPQCFYVPINLCYNYSILIPFQWSIFYLEGYEIIITKNFINRKYCIHVDSWLSEIMFILNNQNLTCAKYTSGRYLLIP